MIEAIMIMAQELCYSTQDSNSCEDYFIQCIYTEFENTNTELFDKCQQETFNFLRGNDADD